MEEWQTKERGMLKKKGMGRKKTFKGKKTKNICLTAFPTLLL